MRRAVRKFIAMRDDASLEPNIFQVVFDTSRDGIVITDEAGSLVRANSAARDRFSVEIASSLLDAETRDDATAAFHADMRAHGRATTELRREARVVAVDGEAHGGRQVLVLRDVTEQRRLEEEVRQLRRIESAGYLTASVLHDLNNLLTPIICLSDALAKQQRGTGDASLAREIREAAVRAAALARQVLPFIRREPSQPHHVDLSTVLADMHGIIERVAGENVVVALSLDENAGETHVDRVELEQVILTLVANARHTMPHGGRLALSTTSVTLGERNEASEDRKPHGSYVVLVATDEGSGMSPRAREEAREESFGRAPKGDALDEAAGVSAAHRFVAKSGGCVSMRSGIGEGTTVAMYLPRTLPLTSHAVAGPPSSGSRGELPRGSETILIVEDDDHVRRVVRAVLEEQGYDVLDAASGELAIGLVARREEAIDLVLVDVVLSGMNGRELVDKLRERDQVAKVLFMSGHTDKAIADHGVNEADDWLLRKAFSPTELSRKVREVLEDVSAKQRQR